MIAVHDVSPFVGRIVVGRRILFAVEISFFVFDRLKSERKREFRSKEKIRRFHFVRIDELRSSVTRQHIENSHLTPLVDVDQQIAESTIIFVNQIDSLRTNLFESLNSAAVDQLKKKNETIFVELDKVRLVSHDRFVGQ